MNIKETQVTLRLQTPSDGKDWLYQSTYEQREKEITHEDGTVETIMEEVESRNFVKSVYLGNNADPWEECTDEEKTAWEEAHKEADQAPEPAEEVEP